MIYLWYTLYFRQVFFFCESEFISVCLSSVLQSRTKISGNNRRRHVIKVSNRFYPYLRNSFYSWIKCDIFVCETVAKQFEVQLVDLVDFEHIFQWQEIEMFLDQLIIFFAGVFGTVPLLKHISDIDEDVKRMDIDRLTLGGIWFCRSEYLRNC